MGFRIEMTAGKRYRWTIETLGKKHKLVEIATYSAPKQE